MSAGVRPLSYTLRWRPDTAFAGAHSSTREGGGGAFKQLTSLLRMPDPRRLDLRASLRDPWQLPQVRQLTQRSSVNVIALLDLTASMGFESGAARLETLASLCAVLAASAYRAGDRFGVIGCDAQVRADVLWPPRRRRGLDREVRDLILSRAPSGASAAGWVAGARLIAQRRALVFLISDFLLPIAVIERTLAALWRHDVVPVVLTERFAPPRWGLVQLRDLETRRRRLVLLRPALLRAWEQARAKHAASLRGVFARFGRAPFAVEDRLDSDALARYLAAR